MKFRLQVSIAPVIVAAITLALFGAPNAPSTAATAKVPANGSVLPNGWVLRPSPGMFRETDTMPQGGAASPDGTILAVVDSGFNPASLRLYSTTNLDSIAIVPLRGAFGRPLWLDSGHILVAGDNTDAILDVDVSKKSVQNISLSKDGDSLSRQICISWPNRPFFGPNVRDVHRRPVVCCSSGPVTDFSTE